LSIRLFLAKGRMAILSPARAAAQAPLQIVIQLPDLDRKLTQNRRGRRSPKDITRAEIVDSWLVWLRAAEGKRAVHRVFHWARGVPLWMLAQRAACTERTIHNRIDRSMAAILREFLVEEMTVEPIEERAALPVRHYHAAWEATTGEAGERQDFGKVYIDGIGYMKDGRRLRDGREKADDKRLYRDRA